MGKFDYVAGRLALDFCNTVDFWEERNGQFVAHDDQIQSLADLGEWAEGAGLQLKGKARPAGPGFANCLKLRSELLGFFSALVSSKRTADHLRAFNRALTGIPARIISATEDGFEWSWGAGNLVEQILGAVILDAADLLTTPDLAFLRRCDAENCGWLFLDKSRNHRRRWCDMKDCGNRSKARRFYQKSKGA